jgi:hypothetical protein
MKSDDANSSPDVPVAGTPADYSEDLYRFYVETADADRTRRVLMDFLGPRHAKRLLRLEYGFEFVAPIQCAPDLIRLLTQENVAVYQLVRRTKVEATWR